MKWLSSLFSLTVCVVFGGGQSVWSLAATEVSSASSAWGHVEAGPPDAILGIAQAFRECSDERKVNVCVGAYRDAQGQPWVLPSVRAAEQMLLDDATQNKEYLPIEGDADFLKCALQFAYGPELDLSTVAGVQTLSGTGACRIGGQYLAKFWKGGESEDEAAPPRIYIPKPTWGNHWAIFRECGLSTHAYRYYDYATNQLDLEGLLEDLNAAPAGSIILLHACAHNPTGCDPTLEQWKQIAQVLRAKGHVAFFDSAYQGFASGNAEKDAAALRYFAIDLQQQEESPPVPVLLAQSFAKNLGLYGERCGTLSVLCASPEERLRVLSQLRLIVRPMYSSPPRHGSSIVKTIFGSAALTEQYTAECATMAHRIQEMRVKLVQALADAGSTHDWSHVANQIGMFAFTGMSAEMCDALTADYAIFLTRDGRISVAGLNDSNLAYVAEAIHAVTKGKTIVQTEQ